MFAQLAAIERLARGGEVDRLAAGHAVGAGYAGPACGAAARVASVEGAALGGVSSSKASACSASPASSALRLAVLHVQCGLPRRRTSLSMQGMSSCTRE